MPAAVEFAGASRITGKAQGHHLFANNLSWIGPLLLNEHLLYAGEIFALRKLCRHDDCTPCATTFFQSWLLRREPGFHIDSTLGIRELHREYRCSIMQAEILRFVCDTIPSAVVAGSFPLAHHLHNHHLAAFRPRDVDIFVFDADDIDVICSAYTSLATAAFPCLHVITTTGWSSSDSEGNDASATPELPTQSGEDNAYTSGWSSLESEGSDASATLERPTQSDVEIAYHGLDLVQNELRSAIQAWVAGYAFGVPKRCPDVSRDAIDSTLTELLLTCSNLPSCICDPNICKIKSHVLRLGTYDKDMYMPTTMVCINILLMAESNAPWGPPHSQLVCSNFDLKACQMILQVDAQCDFVCTSLSGADWTSIPHALEFTTRAFGTPVHRALGAQMSRVLKYIERGFRFPCRTVFSEAVLSSIMALRDAPALRS